MTSSIDPSEALVRLAEEGDALFREAVAAAVVAGGAGFDRGGSVSVMLDGGGRVARVSVVDDWRRRCGLDGLAAAVVGATQDASLRRLRAWGATYDSGTHTGGGGQVDRESNGWSEPGGGARGKEWATAGQGYKGGGPEWVPPGLAGLGTFGEDVPTAIGGSRSASEAWPAGGGVAAAGGGGSLLDRVFVDRRAFAQRLRDVTGGEMSAEERRAALLALLELAESVERGLDDVSGKLDATLRATHDGRSPDGRVTVTMSGGGELTAVRFDRSWLSSASAGAVARQVVAACGAAYAKVDAHGVSRLIADSPLGAAQRVTQDPFGLARRLRITD